MYLRSLCLTLTFLFVSSPVLAQDWSAVQALKPGTRVVVTTKNGREIKGKVAKASPGFLELRKDGGSLQLSRDEIGLIHLTRRGSILKRALIGAAAGAGIGVAVGVVTTVATKTDGLAAAAGFLYGIPAGAAIGAATTGRKRGALVYSNL